MLRYLNELKSIDRVGYEAVTFTGAKGAFRASQRWGGAEAILELWLEARGLRGPAVRKVHVSEVKMLATGKGGGKGTDKAGMLAAARRRWPGISFPDDNAADAAFVGLATVVR